MVFEGALGHLGAGALGGAPKSSGSRGSGSQCGPMSARSAASASRTREETTRQVANQ